MHVRPCACVCACLCVYVHAHVCLRACVCMRVRKNACVSVRVCVSACVCVGARVFVCVALGDRWEGGMEVVVAPRAIIMSFSLFLSLARSLSPQYNALSLLPSLLLLLLPLLLYLSNCGTQVAWRCVGCRWHPIG